MYEYDVVSNVVVLQVLHKARGNQAIPSNLVLVSFPTCFAVQLQITKV